MDTAAPPRVQQGAHIVGDNNTIIIAGRDVIVGSGRGGKRRRGGSRRWLDARLLTFVTAAGLATWAAITELPTSPHWPEGKSALCKDGRYSQSHTRSGTCSSHGGVAEWRYAANDPYWNR